MRNIYLIPIIFFLISCLHSSKDNDSVAVDPIESLDFIISYYDRVSNELDDTVVPENIKLIFPFISGGLFGVASEENLFELNYNENGIYNLGLTPDIFGNELGPEMLVQDEYNEDLLITPTETLLGRLATFAVTTDEIPLVSANYGFYDIKYDHFFLIAYFDRESNMSANISSDGFEILLDVEIPKSGFYAIRNSKPGNVDAMEFSLQAYNPSNNLVFVILKKPEDNSSKPGHSSDVNKFIQSICIDINCKVDHQI